MDDDIDVAALVTELKPLKNISSSFVPDTEANFHFRVPELFEIGEASGRFATMSYKLALHVLVTFTAQVVVRIYKLIALL